MSNHSDFPPDGFPPEFEKILRQPLIGATGEYPDGWMGLRDEGGIQFAVKNKDGKVVVDFGKPVHWVGMNPQDACDLAQSLIRQARNAARATGEPITVHIG